MQLWAQVAEQPVERVTVGRVSTQHSVVAEEGRFTRLRRLDAAHLDVLLKGFEGFELRYRVCTPPGRHNEMDESAVAQPQDHIAHAFRRFLVQFRKDLFVRCCSHPPGQGPFVAYQRSVHGTWFLRRLPVLDVRERGRIRSEDDSFPRILSLPLFVLVLRIPRADPNNPERSIRHGAAHVRRLADSRKVEAVIDHLGLDVEIVHHDFAGGGLRQSEYLAVNPNGMVPTLVDGSFILWESNAIMQYLADKAGGDPLFPAIRGRAPTWCAGSAGSWRISIARSVRSPSKSSPSRASTLDRPTR